MYRYEECLTRCEKSNPSLKSFWVYLRKEDHPHLKTLNRFVAQFPFERMLLWNKFINLLFQQIFNHKNDQFHTSTLKFCFKALWISLGAITPPWKNYINMCLVQMFDNIQKFILISQTFFKLSEAWESWNVISWNQSWTCLEIKVEPNENAISFC